jgi:hypothetical protein
MLADELDYVIGVDTHRDEHALVVVLAGGAVLAERVVRADPGGYRSAFAFAERFAAGRRVWAIEGAGSYGAGLARMLVERGETVLEAGRPSRVQRRSRGKDDALDALLAARGLLASEAATVPRDGGRREALRLLLITRRSGVDARRHALVQMRAVIVTCPDALREQLRRLPTTRLLDRCSRLRKRAAAPPEELAARLTLRMLAHRAQAATAEANELEREIVEPRTRAARRTRRRSDRRRAAARRLVTPRTPALRSRFRAPRRRRPIASIQRTDHPPPPQPRRRPATESRNPHDRPPPPPSRPGDYRLHRTTDRRRKKRAGSNPPAQTLRRSLHVPATRTTTTDDLTRHRSVIAEPWRRRAEPGSNSFKTAVVFLDRVIVSSVAGWFARSSCLFALVWITFGTVYMSAWAVVEGPATDALYTPLLLLYALTFLSPFIAPTLFVYLAIVRILRTSWRPRRIAVLLGPFAATGALFAPWGTATGTHLYDSRWLAIGILVGGAVYGTRVRLDARTQPTSLDLVGRGAEHPPHAASS